MIRLLLEHGADPNIRDTGYDATPAGWAEHHDQPEAHLLLAALEQPDTQATATSDAPGTAPARTSPAGSRDADRRGRVHRGRRRDGSTTSDAASRPTSTGAGSPTRTVSVPAAPAREQALERMRIGLLANGEVSVSAFVEDGDRVLAHVHRAHDDGEDDDRDTPVERFVVAEVHDGQITDMRGYATEPEALDALHAEPLPDSEQR